MSSFCISKRNREKVHSVIRLMAVALCLIFLSVSLFSSVYILVHANHTHDQNGLDGSCTLCTHLTVAENLLKNIYAALASISAVGAYFCICYFCRKLIDAFIISYDPVRLKVRMNN